MIEPIFHIGDVLCLQSSPHAKALFKTRFVLVIKEVKDRTRFQSTSSHVMYDVYDIGHRENTHIVVERERQDKDWKKIA